MVSRTWIVLAMGIVWFVSTMGTGCRSAEQQPAKAVQLAPVEVLPQDIRDARSAIQEAYRFAVANPQLMKRMPCYCGCESVGHSSLYDCFVERVGKDGSVVFSYHSFG